MKVKEIEEYLQVPAEQRSAMIDLLHAFIDYEKYLTSNDSLNLLSTVAIIATVIYSIENQNLPAYVTLIVYIAATRIILDILNYKIFDLSPTKLNSMEDEKYELEKRILHLLEKVDFSFDGWTEQNVSKKIAGLVKEMRPFTAEFKKSRD